MFRLIITDYWLLPAAADVPPLGPPFDFAL